MTHARMTSNPKKECLQQLIACKSIKKTSL